VCCTDQYFNIAFETAFLSMDNLTDAKIQLLNVRQRYNLKSCHQILIGKVFMRFGGLHCYFLANLK
jgi:hypothetical protein